MIDRTHSARFYFRNRHFFFIDLVLFVLTPLWALGLRIDNDVALIIENEGYQTGLLVITLVFSAIKLTVFLAGGLYKHYWRYASIDELSSVAILTGAAVALQTLVFAILTSLQIVTLPRSLPLLDGLLTILLVGGLRFSVRAMGKKAQRRTVSGKAAQRTLIIGAGDAGVTLVQELDRNPHLNLLPIAFVDDDPCKQNHQIRGLPVAGDRNDILDLVRTWNIQAAIIAMPSVSGKVLRDIVAICQVAGIKTQTLPALQDILSGTSNLRNSLRDVQIEDLLRRDPIRTDIQQVRQLIKGKRILITGAGGSIGSELCRQIYRCQPQEIILLGHGENSVFQIQQELCQFSAEVNKQGHREQTAPTLTPCIADLRHPARLRYVFEQYQPQILFHAAAHKHVPLMEDNPPEAITNNVLGTQLLVDLAVEYDVERFVMISTDKAVNPTSVMGASKRVAEMVVLQAAHISGKPYGVVRFGNVLGSRGSVIPTFKQQIAEGGPVTVTHPEMRRYFMTIPEAVQLVLQGAVINGGGQILMLDMGSPVKIVDLAKDLICLSGYEVGKDIQITFTGLRPGEKLYEELFLPDEQYHPTEHQKLLVVKNASQMVSPHLSQVVADLLQSAAVNDTQGIRALLGKVVPGYLAPSPAYKV